MKQQRLFVQKAFSRYKGIVKSVFSVVIIIAIFVSGYVLSSNLLTKQISNSEFEFYEQIARDVYEQGERVIYEVPNEVNLEKTSTSITISSKGTNRGKVIASLQNGELIFTHDKEIGEAVAVGILTGILFVLVLVLLWIGIPYTYKAIKKRK